MYTVTRETCVYRFITLVYFFAYHLFKLLLMEINYLKEKKYLISSIYFMLAASFYAFFRETLRNV